VGRFRLHPKVRIVALHVPGTTETYRQILRVGAERNDCLVATDNTDQLLRAVKIANYLEYKRERLGRSPADFQRTVVPAGSFLEANVL
jgi:hypothetical protein